MTQSCAGRDLAAGNSRSRRLLWGLPTLLLVASSFGPPLLRDVVWISSLTIMGVACVANARRCSRTHCYVTGPVFLSGAAAVGVRAIGAASFPWVWIPLGVAAGVLAGYGFEALRGRYAREQCA